MLLWLLLPLGVLLVSVLAWGDDCVPTPVPQAAVRLAWHRPVFPAGVTPLPPVLEVQSGGGAWLPLPSPSADATTTEVAGLAVGTHTFRLAAPATTAAGQTLLAPWATPGTPPPCVTVTAAPPLPEQPGPLTVTSEPEHRSLLTWDNTDPSQREVALQWKKNRAATDWKLLAIVFGTRFRDREAATARCYRHAYADVTPRVWSEAVCSAQREVLSELVALDEELPLPPHRLAVSLLPSGAPAPVRLGWNAPTDGLMPTHYHLYRVQGRCPPTVQPTPVTLPQSTLTVTGVTTEVLPTYRKEHAIDGSVSTFWHTAWSPTSPPRPHALTLDLGHVAQVVGLTYLPRQDGAATTAGASNGNIGTYEVHVSRDGTTWGPPAASGTFPAQRQEHRVTFAATEGRFVRLTSLREAAGRPYTNIAEVTVQVQPWPPVAWQRVGTVPASQLTFTDTVPTLPACWYATSALADGRESPPSHMVGGEAVDVPTLAPATALRLVLP